MNNIIPFQFESHNIQVIVDNDGEFHFVAKEVAEILGYSDAYEMTKRLDDDEKSNRQIAGLGTQYGGRGVTIINESGLYSSILGSNKPEAKPFKRWVTHDVIPSVRKTGSYTAPKAKATTITPVAKDFTIAFRIARLIGCDKNAAAISANNYVFQNTGTNVLSLLGQTHLEADKQALFFNVSDLQPGISGQKMNKMLEGAGLQTNEDGKWVPTQAGMKFCRVFDTGKKHSNGTPVQQIKWFREVLGKLSVAEAV